MRYFAHLLHEKQLSLSEEIYDSCRINDVFAITIKPFLTEADSSVSLLINIVTADFREGLQDGLFKNEWFQSKSVVETLKITLLEYLNDLKVWLKKENDIKLVLIGVLRVVSGSYLEFLLLSGMNITGGINERLQQDYEVNLPLFLFFLLKKILSLSLNLHSLFLLLLLLYFKLNRLYNKVFVNVVLIFNMI